MSEPPNGTSTTGQLMPPQQSQQQQQHAQDSAHTSLHISTSLEIHPTHATPRYWASAGGDGAGEKLEATASGINHPSHVTHHLRVHADSEHDAEAGVAPLLSPASGAHSQAKYALPSYTQNGASHFFHHHTSQHQHSLHQDHAQQTAAAHSGGGGLAPAASSRHTVLRILATLLACAAWSLVSPATVIVNTHLMKDAGFTYPTTIALMGLVSTTALSAVAVRFVVPPHRRVRVSRRFFLSRVLPTGITMALTFQMGNAAYLYLSFSFLQMLKALTPVITMIMVCAVGLERPTAGLVASVALISLGVGMASYGEIHLSPIGLALMLSSIVSECARCVMTQQLLAGAAMHPLEGTAYIGLASSISLSVQVALFELRQLVANRAWHLLAAHPWQTAAVAVAGYSVNSLAILVINLASSLTLKVLGTIKDIGLILFGVAVRHEVVTPLQVYGYSLSLIGFTAYNMIQAHRTPAGGDGARSTAVHSKTG